LTIGCQSESTRLIGVGSSQVELKRDQLNPTHTGLVHFFG